MLTRLEIEQKILDEYAKGRAEKQKQTEINLSLARQNSEFDSTYKQIKDLEYKIAEQTSLKNDTTNLKKQLTELKEKQQSTLKNLNIPQNAFSITYDCEKCKDSGFIGREKCSCFKDKINKELIKNSGLEETSLASFENFDPTITSDPKHQQNLIKLKDVLEVYSQKFPYSTIRTFIVSGKTGVGKTFLLECATTEIIKRGFSVTYLTAFQLNNQFVKYHSCFDANKQSYLDILIEPDLLVIDDLGTEPMLNNITKEYLYLIISERMLKSKGTLISTNLDSGQILARYGERIFSRLLDKSRSTILKLDGTDIRTKKRS